jgi:hypothetical protein
MHQYYYHCLLIDRGIIWSNVCSMEYKLHLAQRSGIPDIDAFQAALSDPALAAQVRYESALVC